MHLNPVWRDRANFIIGAWVPPIEEGSTIRGWEQLWSRQLADNRFEICCIPFFASDLALGDEVETATEDGETYIIQRVVKPSGHWTFRTWFGDLPDPVIRNEVADEVLREVEQLGCLTEWYSANLLGISAPSDSQAQAVADLLCRREQLGHLTYQTGKTK